jgi:hypothetical protein
VGRSALVTLDPRHLRGSHEPGRLLERDPLQRHKMLELAGAGDETWWSCQGSACGPRAGAAGSGGLDGVDALDSPGLEPFGFHDLEAGCRDLGELAAGEVLAGGADRDAL